MISQAEQDYLKQNLQKKFFDTAVARREYWDSQNQPEKAIKVQDEINAVQSYIQYLEDKVQFKKYKTLVLNKYGDLALLPHAEYVEKAVLGAILVSEVSKNIVFEIVGLKPAHFYTEQHAVIFEAAIILYQQNAPIDLITVHNQLIKMKQLENIGDSYYLIELTNSAPSIANVEFHSRILQQFFISRETIKVASDTITAALEGSEDSLELIEKTRENLNLIIEKIANKELWH